MSFHASSRRVKVNLSVDGSSLSQSIKKLNYSNAVNDDSDHLLPGCSACGEVEIEFYGEIAQDLLGKEMQVNISAYGNNSEVEAILGLFTIDKQKRNKVHAVDKMAVLDGVDFVSTLEYPAKASSVLAEVSQLTGITINWNTDFSDHIIDMDSLIVSKKPVGYTCREILSYVAGMSGQHAIDGSQLAVLNFPNHIVLRDYFNDNFVVTPSLIYQDGFELKTEAVQSDKKTTYVEYKVTAGSNGTDKSSCPENPEPDDVRYLQNPDEFASDAEFISINGYVSENFYAPYWVIFKYTNIDLSDVGAPRYVVYFFNTPSTFYGGYEAGFIPSRDVYYLRSTEVYTGTFQNSNGYGDWQDESYAAGEYQNFDWNWFAYAPTTRSNVDFEFRPNGADLSIRKQFWQVVAANYDVYLTDGTLYCAKNSASVGSMRTGGSTGGGGVEYGEGDYTNPLIDENNVAITQSMQTAHTYWPGTLKWRGNPFIRPGTEIAVTGRLGRSIPFLICSLRLHYDGGLYMEAECHGSTGVVDKKTGLQRELTKIRGLKALMEVNSNE